MEPQRKAKCGSLLPQTASALLGPRHQTRKELKKPPLLICSPLSWLTRQQPDDTEEGDLDRPLRDIWTSGDTNRKKKKLLSRLSHGTFCRNLNHASFGIAAMSCCPQVVVWGALRKLLLNHPVHPS